MATHSDTDRTSRLPTLRRFREERLRMSLDTAAERAEIVARIAADVTEMIIAAQKDLAGLQNARIEPRAELRRALAAFKQELSVEVRETLETFAAERAAQAADHRNLTDAFLASLRKDVETIVSTDFV